MRIPSTRYREIGNHEKEKKKRQFPVSFFDSMDRCVHGVFPLVSCDLWVSSEKKPVPVKETNGLWQKFPLSPVGAETF
jgi:hypothetical protein